MRTSDECLTKASDMVRLADECRTWEMRDSFLSLANDWRKAAREADRQDAAERDQISN